jgi:hypothetical protein
MCTACKNKISGMKKRKKVVRRRRRIRGVDSASLSSMVTNDLLPTAGGYLAGTYLPGILGKASPKAAPYANYAAIGIGAFLGISQKGMLSRVGLGLATSGTVGVVQDLMDGQGGTKGLGLLEYGQPSYRIAGYSPSNQNNVPAPNQSTITVQ